MTMSKTSNFLRTILGGLNSNTVQANTGGLIVLILTSIYNMELIQSNPEYLAIGAGIMALVNIVLRAKTSKPLLER